ncbi:hypothetical protein ACWEF6_05495 [Amycolatopsis sp. NPDC004772]
MSTGLALALAAVLASLLSYAELAASHRKRLSLKAFHYIAGKISLDALMAILAFPLIAKAYPNFQLTQEPIMQLLLAAVIGPGFIRAKLTLMASKVEPKNFGPAEVFKYYTKWLDDSIDQISSIEQTLWFSRQVTPVLSRYPIERLKEDATGYIEGLEKLETKTKIRILKVIEDDARAASVEGEEKAKKAILQHVLDNQGRRFIERLMRQAG